MKYGNSDGSLEGLAVQRGLPVNKGQCFTLSLLGSCVRFMTAARQLRGEKERPGKGIEVAARLAQVIWVYRRAEQQGWEYTAEPALTSW